MLLTIAMPVQLPKMQFFDQQGKPLVGGKIYSYKVGTGEFKPTYKNAQKTALNRNPVVLDEAGCAFIYFNGNHHLKIFDKNDQFIEERWVPSTEFRTFFFDKFGKALRFGKVYTHDFESTILKPSYQNPEKTVRNTNPVVLDEDGSAMMCMNGSYRLRVYDEKGVFQGDQDFFRNVAYALTSKPYPVYFDDVLVVDFDTLDSKFGGTSLAESVGTKFITLNPIRKDAVIYSDYKCDPENLTTALNVLSPVRVDTVIYSSYKLEPENLSTVFNVLNPKREKLLITHPMDVEMISTQFSVLNPVRK